MKQGLSSIGVVLIILIILAVLGGGGYLIYSSYVKKICCLPQCEEMTKKECLQLDGKPADKEKCDEVNECKIVPVGGSLETGEGFKATAKAEATGLPAADGTADYVFNLEVTTCQDEVTNADWEGKWDWLWTYKSSIGTHTDPDAGEISFETGEDGNFSVNIFGDTPTQGQITDDSIKMEFDMVGIVGHVTVTGPVTQGGGSDCEEE